MNLTLAERERDACIAGNNELAHVIAQLDRACELLDTLAVEVERVANDSPYKEAARLNGLAETANNFLREITQ